MRENKGVWSLMNGKILTVTIFSLCAAFPSEGSAAESLADWQTAEALSGCSSIPYGEQRRRCMDAMVDVHDPMKWNCQDVAGTKNYLEAAEAIEKQIKELDSKTPKEPDKIAELSSRQVKQKEFAAGAKRELELRLQTAQTTLAARNIVQKKFDEAISLANQESDPAIKAIAQKLVPRWKESVQKHVQAVIDVTKGVQICQDRLAGKY
jgi:hypothetical protein